MERWAAACLAVSLLIFVPYNLSTQAISGQPPAAASVAGSLQVSLGTIPNATFPMDNSLTHVFFVTNTAAQNLSITFHASNSKGADVPMFPQPQTLTLRPGEQRRLTMLIDQSPNFPEIEAYPGSPLAPGNYTVPLKYTIASQSNPKDNQSFTVDYHFRVVDTTKPDREMLISGEVTDSSGGPLQGQSLQLTSQSTAQYSNVTAADGSFLFDVPKYSHWVIVLGGTTSAGSSPPNGGVVYQPKYVFVNPAVSTYKIVLAPATKVAQASFQTARMVNTPIGFWMGDVSSDGSRVLLVEGMEIWPPGGANQTQSQLMLYKVDGTQLWTYNMGWESWGASLSRDSKYAAYVTLAPFGTLFNGSSTVGLLNATTGQAIWVKTMSNSNFPLSPNGPVGHPCIVARLSQTGSYLAIGCTNGMFYLTDRSTGNVIWSKYLVGQVRDVLFSPDDTNVYVGTDPYLFKFTTSNGAFMWKADILSWPLVDGLSLSSDGSLIASMVKTGYASLVRTSDGGVLWSYDTGGIGQWAAISPDGTKVAADSFGGMWVFNAAGGQPVWRVAGAKDGKFSADGNFIIGPSSSIFTSDGTQATTLIQAQGGLPPVFTYQFVYLSSDLTRAVASVAGGGGNTNTGVYFFSGSASYAQATTTTATTTVITSFTSTQPITTTSKTTSPTTTSSLSSSTTTASITPSSTTEQPTTSGTTAPPTSTTSASTSTQTSEGIPEAPYQPLAAVFLTLVIAASYVLINGRKIRSGRVRSVH